MRLEQTIAAQCDSCGRWKTLTEGTSYPQLTFVRGQRTLRLMPLDLRQRPLSEIIAIFVATGSVVTSGRNIDGEHARYEAPEALPHRMRREKYFLVCGACKESWAPPFTAAAAQELERVRLATTAGVDELAALRAENERLRLALETVRSTTEAVAS